MTRRSTLTCGRPTARSTGPSPTEIFFALQALGNPMAAAGSNNPTVERFRQIRQMYPSLPVELADVASSLPVSTEVLDRMVTQEAQRRAIESGRRR